MDRARLMSVVRPYDNNLNTEMTFSITTSDPQSGINAFEARETRASVMGCDMASSVAADLADATSHRARLLLDMYGSHIWPEGAGKRLLA
jgi:hypothetical protein